MKYGDPVATWRIAVDTFDFFKETPVWKELVGSGGNLVVAPSAYGAVPTASYWVAENISELIEGEGLAVEKLKFEREGGFGCHNYSRLGLEERRKVLEDRRIWLETDVDLTGKTILVFDDLRSTGAHEESLREVLSAQEGITRVVFLYYVGFTSHLSHSRPQDEDVLNHVEISDLEDLYRLLLQSPTSLLLNARLVKFFLKAGVSQPKEFETCLSKFPIEFLMQVQQAAQSQDGYARREPYRRGFEALQSHLLPLIQ